MDSDPPFCIFPGQVILVYLPYIYIYICQAQNPSETHNPKTQIIIITLRKNSWALFHFIQIFQTISDKIFLLNHFFKHLGSPFPRNQCCSHEISSQTPLVIQHWLREKRNSAICEFLTLWQGFLSLNVDRKLLNDSLSRMIVNILFVIRWWRYFIQ